MNHSGFCEKALEPRDWEAFRQLGHRMVDDATDFLASIKERPVWRSVPAETLKRLEAPAPAKGIGPEAAYERFLSDVLPYATGNIHPRFWGWVVGSGAPIAVLAEFLAAVLNCNLSGLGGAAPVVERQVIAWIIELFGLDSSSSGILTSGASMANAAGLAVGLTARSPYDVQHKGVAAASRPPVVYTSSTAHFSVEKACRLLGLGTAALRTIPTDHRFRIDVDALADCINEDRREGHAPLAVVGQAGTTATGAIDPLDALADLAEAEGLWLHVDGAIGAAVAMVPEERERVRGLERADSIALDFHKWMLMPIEAGVLLVRDREAHERTFRTTASYITPLRGGIGAPLPGTYFTDFGPQQSRHFRALKIWMSLLAHGPEPFREVIRRNLRQAQHLLRLIEQSPALELLAPVSLNIVCFGVRHCNSTIADAINRDIVVELQETGFAAPSHAIVGGRFAIRVCLTNHRTEDADLDALVRRVEELATVRRQSQ